MASSSTPPPHPPPPAADFDSGEEDERPRAADHPAPAAALVDDVGRSSKVSAEDEAGTGAGHTDKAAHTDEAGAAAEDSAAAPAAALHTQPTDDELVKSYLEPWVSTRAAPAIPFIHSTDVYRSEPAVLTRAFRPAMSEDGAITWYFLTPLRAKGQHILRMVAGGAGWWRVEARGKPVLDPVDGRHLGSRHAFSFLKKRADGTRTRDDWIMSEFRLDGEGLQALCKIYASPRHQDDKVGAPLVPAAGEADERPGAGVARAGTAPDEGSGASAAVETAACAGGGQGEGEASAAPAAPAPISTHFLCPSCGCQLQVALAPPPARALGV